MPYVQTSAPASEPLSLTEAKLHLRVTDTAQDSLITAIISAARVHAENVTQRQLMTSTWQLILDAFPGAYWAGTAIGRTLLRPDAILLNKCPVQSVSSIQYQDMTGTWQTLSTSVYVVDTSCEPTRITPKFGQIWPVTLPQIGAVKVTFDAGYGDATKVPEGVKAWMKVRVGTLYENREEIAILNRGQIKELPFVDSLLDPYRVVTY